MRHQLEREHVVVPCVGRHSSLTCPTVRCTKRCLLHSCTPGRSPPPAPPPLPRPCPLPPIPLPPIPLPPSPPPLPSPPLPCIIKIYQVFQSIAGSHYYVLLNMSTIAVFRFIATFSPLPPPPRPPVREPVVKIIRLARFGSWQSKLS